MKIYISGKITGTTDYMERFARAEKHLRNAGFIPVNPAKVNGQLPPETTHSEYMTTSLAMLEFCECIYMLDGWKTSPGANMEFGFALANNKKIYFEGEL